MLDIKFIRENLKLIKENNKNRRVKVDVDGLLKLDNQRKEKLKAIEDLRFLRNKKSKGKPSEEEIKKMREVGDSIKKLEEELDTIEKSYTDILLQIPNLTHPDSPIGGEENFIVRETLGEKPSFDFAPKTHDELAKELDLLDFERATKVVGSKFYYVKNDLVKLNRALISYGIEIAEKHGYQLIETPDLAKLQILSGTGYSPRGEESHIYTIDETDVGLIATAEITIGGYHADEILDFANGPIKYAALSHCFRREAGAYGRISKGLYRVHQFTKLEMFIFCKPEDSEMLHQEMLEIEKEINNGLGLHYRVIDIATEDLGGPAYRKYDLEAWMTMVGENGGYGEITSTSNCTDYQAKRLNIKYKNEEGGNTFVHTLNGTAIALSRTPVAIMEQFQQKDGSIKIPEVLQKFIGKNVIK